MKIIFLDVDGVLHSATARPEAMFRPVPMAVLKTLVRESGAKIVLHSGWKNMLDAHLRPVLPQAELLLSALSCAGLSLFDVTPDFADETILKTRTFSRIKPSEIKSWLASCPSVAGWVVLDDIPLRDELIASHQLVTDPHTGLTEADVPKALDILSLHNPLFS